MMARGLVPERAAWLAMSLSAGLLMPAAAQNPPAPAPNPTPNPPAPGAQPAAGGEKKADAPKPPVKPGQPKPYADVITKEAKSQDGLFKVHRIDEKLYFEIPPAMLGRDMLWQTEIAELASQYGYPGTAVNDRVVCWSRRANKVYLRSVNYDIRTEDQGALKTGIEAASLQPIVQAFNVEAEGEGGTAVIDVTSLFTSDPSEFSVKNRLRAAGADPSRGYLDRVTAFPTNIETRTMLTFIAQPRTVLGPSGPIALGGGAGSTSALVHYSLTLLPETPMLGRYRDNRVGFFSESFSLYGTPRHRVEEKEYIARYRLEKKDPGAAVSEPVKPIVYYVSREVPDKWRSYVKKGIEDWQPAFEQAGFKNAILAKDAPSRKDDPTWDPEDARYSVIRWAPSATQNAMGPHVSDPRSGEIISAHVIVWHNILELLENWYFSQAGPLDYRAQKMPFPDELMGELVRYVVAHEVGHTLGLEHNFKASSAYTVAQLRNREFTEKNGVSPSIMDYSRFNYVAQPGDEARLIGKVGEYDRFAIEWGYKPIPGAKTAEEEKPALDALASKQVTEPALRFGNYTNPADPTEETEDIGSDPIEATRMGLKNIRRAARLLLPATTRLGEDYSLLRSTYGELDNQWFTELSHVIRLVGGVVTTEYHGGRGGDVYVPVPAAVQRKAVQFILTEGLLEPSEMLDPAVLNKIQPTGAVSLVTGKARTLLNSLLSEARIRRMLDNEAVRGGQAYGVEQLVGDITDAVWKDLDAPAPRIDIYRRELQRSYLSTVDRKLNGAGASDTDLKPLARERLQLLAKQIDRTLPRTADKMTQAHLRSTRKDIERILDGKSPAALGRGGISFADLFGARNEDQGFGCFSRSDLFRRLELDETPAPTR